MVNDLVIGNRFRIEERFIQHVSGVVVRGRYRLNLAHPLWNTPFYAVGWDEIFINLNDQHEGPTHGYEQNRLFGGIGVHVGSYLRMDVGYLWRHLDRRSGPSSNDHILSITLSATTNPKPAKNPLKNRFSEPDPR